MALAVLAASALRLAAVPGVLALVVRDGTAAGNTGSHITRVDDLFSNDLRTNNQRL